MHLIDTGEAVTMRTRKNPFSLPQTVTFSVGEQRDATWVAHALDFDLVCVANTRAKAVEKLRLAVKVYVEYGLVNNWIGDIIFPAPEEYWLKLQGKMAEIMPPIEIEDTRMSVHEALLDEHRAAACTA
jgi:hypothetical protein